MDKATLERLDDEDWNLSKKSKLPIPAKTLLKLGKCCGSKCMNCPYEPKQSITLTWSPDFHQDINAPARPYEYDKQMIRDMLEKVLDSPEEYKPAGYTGCLIRYAAI